MPDEIPISEVRRVVIEYEIRVPQGSPMRNEPAAQAQTPNIEELARQIRRELLRTGVRNLNVGLS